MIIDLEPSRISGSLRVPPSKSLGHRALICAGLAGGDSIIRHLGSSKDMEATLNCLKALGASFTIENEDENGIFRTVYMHGTNPAKLDMHASVTLDAYESGSTIRFFIPVAAAGSEWVTFLGKPSLLVRPMGIYADLFARQNLPFEQSEEGIRFHGPLAGGSYTIDGSISSQFLSGLLLAAPFLGGIDLHVEAPYQSRSYVNLTLDMMRTFGIHIEEPDSFTYIIRKDEAYTCCEADVEADWSQAAFFLVLGMLNAPILLKGLNPASLQGDAVIMDAVRLAGGKLEWTKDGLLVSPGTRQAFDFDLADCPDLGPILCALAAMVPGQSVLRHASRLRYKECDRIAAMEDELRKWGVDIHSTEDEIYITGRTDWSSTDTVVIDGHNDHRIVMAMAVFSVCAKTPARIVGAQAVTKSYPHFFDDLKSIQGKVVQS